MEGVAFDVEGSHTSWCCYMYTMVEEKSQAVDQVQLPCASCPRDYQSQLWWVVSLSIFPHNIVGLQLLSLEMLRVSRGGEGLLSSCLTVLRNEGWHFLHVGICLCYSGPVGGILALHARL